MKRFIVMMRFWNGHGFEDRAKEVEGIKEVGSLVLWILKTVRPYQISISDMNAGDPIPNPHAKELNADWIKVKTNGH